jgi:hypothetical protein
MENWRDGVMKMRIKKCAVAQPKGRAQGIGINKMTNLHKKYIAYIKNQPARHQK